MRARMARLDMVLGGIEVSLARAVRIRIAARVEGESLPTVRGRDSAAAWWWRDGREPIVVAVRTMQ